MVFAPRRLKPAYEWRSGSSAPSIQSPAAQGCQKTQQIMPSASLSNLIASINVYYEI